MGVSSAFFLFWSKGLRGSTHRASGRSTRHHGTGTTDQEQEEEAIYRDIPEELRTLIEPVVDEHGCELVDVEVARNRGQGLLRITVDSPSADGRVPIERCVAISREVETLLDAADAMTGAYQLEVSSPGLDRLLGREKDFVAAVGHQVKLRTRRPFEGRKRFKGRLLAMDEQCEPAVLEVEVDGESFAIPFDEVEKANTIYEFTSADFSKQGGGKQGPRNTHDKRKKRSGRARRQVEKS